MESNMTGYSWLTTPIHKNTLKHLKLEWQTNPSIIDAVKMSFDGSIVAILTSRVQTHLSDPEIEKIRMGFAKMPKSFKIESEDDFYKYLAHYVEIAEE